MPPSLWWQGVERVSLQWERGVDAVTSLDFAGFVGQSMMLVRS